MEIDGVSQRVICLKEAQKTSLLGSVRTNDSITACQAFKIEIYLSGKVQKTALTGLEAS